MITPSKPLAHVPGTPPSLLVAASGFGFPKCQDMDMPLDAGAENKQVKVASQRSEPGFDEVLEISGDEIADHEALHARLPVKSDSAAGGLQKLDFENNNSDVQDFEHLSETSEDSSQQKGESSSMAPRGMVGCVGRDHKGRCICFNHNFSECKGAVDGAFCAKGRHVCFKANCFKPHPFCKANANEVLQEE